MQLFGDFGLTDRERTVFLRDGGDTSEDDQMRPTIQQEYDQAVEEVRDFDEYYDDDEEYQRAVDKSGHSQNSMNFSLAGSSY